VPGEDRGEAGVFKAQVKIAAFFLNVSRRAFLEYWSTIIANRTPEIANTMPS
jgi:hypothetical protein